MRTNRPPHMPWFDYLGSYRYFLTFCTHHRHRAFVSDDRVDVCVSQILKVASNQSFAIVAYCFMPDHVHLLVEGQADDADARALIARLKQSTGFHYQRRFGHRLWQRFNYERTLREQDATLSVARYILENPVRAGLVARAEDYPYVGSTVYSIGEILDAIQWERRVG